MIEFRPLNLRDVLHVCHNMRLRDWQEVINMVPRAAAKPDILAMMCMQVSKFGLVACLDGDPVAVIQYGEVHEGTWRAGLFATDRWPMVRRAVVRELIEGCIPYVLAQGVVYCDAYSDVQHTEAHRMLEFMGFRRSAILEGYGSHGRDFYLYVVTKKDLENHVLFRRRWKHQGRDDHGRGYGQGDS